MKPIGATWKRDWSSVNRLNFILTTHCNLRCPDCDARIPYREPKHVDWEYVEHAASFMRGKLPWLVITGGECLTHPNFDEWAPKLRELFSVPKLTIETNGFLAPKHEEALRYFDHIRVTRYSHATFKLSRKPYSVDNKEEVDWLERKFPNNLIIVWPEHQPLDRRDGPAICNLLDWEALCYIEGMLYPCCACAGIPESKGIVLQPGWQEMIVQTPLPCEHCPYGTKA